MTTKGLKFRTTGSRCASATARNALIKVCVLSLAFAAGLCRADQIKTVSGDTYQGKVVSVNDQSLVLQSEVLGRITLPRAKIASIQFGTAEAAAANVPIPIATNRSSITNRPAQGTVTNLAAALAEPGQMQASEEIKAQILGSATPDAKAKYDEMINDLATGKLSVNDLRVQAKAAADQLRAFQRELGPESDEALSSYLAILDSFLKETPSSQAGKTNDPGRRTNQTPKP